MDSVRNDPELATELITLLGKELKAARQRIKDLEGQTSHGNFREDSLMRNDRESREHAEISETSVGPKAELEKLTAENLALRLLLDEYQLRVKEELTEEKHPIPPEQRRDEPNLDLQNKVKELEEALKVYHGKYKVQKEAKQTLRQSLAELETRIKDLTRENQKLRQAAELSSSKVVPTKQPSLPGRPEFTDFMLKLPQYTEKPHYLSLRPICRRGVDITAYLNSDSKLAKFSSSFLYFPGRLLWCGRQHGLAFGPQHVFDASKDQWINKSTFEGKYGKEFQLFYLTKGSIFYGGIYTCHNLRSWSPEGSPMPTERVSPEAMVEATLENRESVTDSGSLPLEKVIQQLYVNQVLKVEAMGLQCIGFDYELYEALDRRFQAGLPVHGKREGKREGSQLEGGPSAKRIRGTTS